MIGSNNFRSESTGAKCPTIHFRVRNVHFKEYISPACLDYFSLDEFTPLCLKIYAFPDTGTPHVTQHVGNQKQPKFLAPKIPAFANFPLPFQPGDESTTKKRHEKDLSESKTRDCSMIECISLSKKSTRARRGWEVFLLEAWEKKNWRSNIIKYCANSTKSDTFQPHQLLLQLPRNTPVSAYKLYSSCSYSILSYSSLSYSTLSLCTFHFQVMIFKSPEPKSFSTKLRLRIQKWTEKSYKWDRPGICKTKQSKLTSWQLELFKMNLWGRCHHPALLWIWLFFRYLV